MLTTISRRFIRKNRINPDKAASIPIETRPEPPRLPQYESFELPRTVSKDIPFRVNRTSNGNLPVYEVYRSAGRTVSTVVRLFEGDQEAMRQSLMRVCESPVRVRYGSFEVRGLHSWKIKEWLESIHMWDGGLLFFFVCLFIFVCVNIFEYHRCGGIRVNTRTQAPGACIEVFVLKFRRLTSAHVVSVCVCMNLQRNTNFLHCVERSNFY